MSNQKRLYSDLEKDLTDLLMTAPSQWQTPEQFRSSLIDIFKKFHTQSPVVGENLNIPDWS